MQPEPSLFANAKNSEIWHTDPFYFQTNSTFLVPDKAWKVETVLFSLVSVRECGEIAIHRLVLRLRDPLVIGNDMPALKTLSLHQFFSDLKIIQISLIVTL